MRCRRVQKWMNESVDGTLPMRRAERLEAHLKDCAPCREFMSDLRLIAEAASDLENPSPSDTVWHNIRSRLSEKDGRVFSPAEEKGDIKRPGRKILAMRYAAAAAAALVLIAGGVFIGVRLDRRAPSPLFVNEVEYTLAKLDEAEHYYQQAIKALTEAFAAQRGVLTPQVVEMFERNLLVIDDTIQACRLAVAAEPEDIEARKYLLAAYMDKVALLDAMLESPRTTPGIVNQGRGL